MLAKFIARPFMAKTLNYKFASAAAIDYYSLLGIDRGATKEQIQHAFAKITQNVNPDSNPTLYNRISEAFVILTDVKARDAYDSLMKSRRSSYINEPSTPQKPNSYLADRKAQRSQQLAKSFNLDQFGRYKGGLPNKSGYERGNAMGEVGQLHHLNDFEYKKDMFPEYSRVDQSTAEAFKNFHQDEREYRTMKKTWNTMQVDYNFFTFKKTRSTYWWYWRLIIVVMFLLPPIVRFGNLVEKELGKSEGDKRKAAKEERQRKREEEEKARSEA